MKVVWTEPAYNQLKSIHQYISQTSIEYADRMIDRITHRSEQIAQYPLSGRIVPEYGHKMVREIIERPYRIIYHILTNQVEVLAVIHGAQDFESQMS